MYTINSFDAVALLSGGLDSILAARLVQDQGKRVLCLHFYSPFFGDPAMLPAWEKAYGLTIQAVDLSEEFASLLRTRPPHGFGKVLNPCVDCKIIMMRKALAIMHEFSARCIISGEVLGQRPMSQRRDTLQIIQRDAGVKGLLLRPLSAKLLKSTAVEDSGFIDRNRLLAINGRGRKEQLRLAEDMGFSDIPTPAGGCRLTEKENARSYWPLLALYPGNQVSANDFYLANAGRQYWRRISLPRWLCVGRQQADNDRLLSLAREGDLLFKCADFPGPIALGRQFPGQLWDEESIMSAAAFMASFSPKARRAAEKEASETAVRLHSGALGLDGPGRMLRVAIARSPEWQEYPWEEAREGIRAERRERPPENNPTPV